MPESETYLNTDSEEEEVKEEERGKLNPHARNGGNLVKVLLKKFLTFLEIIGILEEKNVEYDTQLARFRLYYEEFRNLLSANNSFLENISGLEQKFFIHRDYHLSYLKSKVIRMVEDVGAMVKSIGVISGFRYPKLDAVFRGISENLALMLNEIPDDESSDMILDLSQVHSRNANLVSSKMANLGEVRNVLGLPAPDGFVITFAACKMLFENSGLLPVIENEHQAITHNSKDILDVSRFLEGHISEIKIPEQLSTRIFQAFDRLSSRTARDLRLSVRSSAMGEDTELSFAGQYLSLLNVGRNNLLEAYLKVLGSLFSPEAVHYRFLHNLPGESALMAVGCTSMIDAIGSGIVFSDDPNHPGHIIINAVSGLGSTLAEGRTSPEEITLTKNPDPAVISRVSALQGTKLICRKDGGVEEVSIEQDSENEPVLEDHEAVLLARWVIKLERYFGSPQDMEWAMDKNRRLYVLQTRPLSIVADVSNKEESVKGFELYIKEGETACAGVGYGIAVHMDEDGDFNEFPEGGILITKRPSPKFVRIMTRSRAIVADSGSTTGHMASLARELHLPTLLNTKNAFMVIPDRAIITVDATNGYVYAGRVAELLKTANYAAHTENSIPKARAGKKTMEWEKIIDLITPLSLTNPRSPCFTPEECRSLHDLTRFIHEKSYEEMFCLGESLGDFRSASFYLDVFLPIDLYIIDLGNGIEKPERGRKIKIKQIKSAPLAAILKGMLHEKIPRFGARPFDMGGFFNLMLRHSMINLEHERSFRSPSYAIVSNIYLNYTSRVGYHFGVVDAYCGKTANKNYINLMFRGGAADIIRRSRRAKAFGVILKQLGFNVETNQDVVTARISKTVTHETEEKLEMIGRLLQFMRQMDLSMVNDSFITTVTEAFLKGDYKFEKLVRGK